MEKNKVVLDTSVLLVPGRSPSRDIFTELLKLLGNYEAIIPQYVLDELRGIQHNPKKERRIRDAAKLAIALVEKMVVDCELKAAARTGLSPAGAAGFVYEVRIEGTARPKKPVDDALVDFAKKLSAWLCTSDRGLRQKAESAGLSVLFIGPLKYPKKSRVKR